MVNKVEYMKLLHSADLDIEPPEQRHETRRRIWDAYTAAVCDIDLYCYRFRKERTTQHTSKLVRYFTSTDTRQMFSRLMCKSLILKTPVSSVDVASELVITYKSATTMIKECLDAGWIEEPSAKLYQASDELLDLFQETYVKDIYRHTHDVARLRNLVTEYWWFLHNRTDLALET
jgi:hypothetical protein